MKDLLVTLGGSAGFIALVNMVVKAIVERRHRGAEVETLSATATETISKAAAGVVEQLSGDNVRLRKENAEQRVHIEDLEVRVDVLEQRDLEFRRYLDDERRTLQLHAAWDVMATTAVNAAIPPIDLPPPPPLTPPTRPPGSEGV